MMGGFRAGSFGVVKNLTILPDGVIKGGKFRYEADFSGEVSYSGWVKVKLGFFTKTHEFDGKLKVNPSSLLGKAYDEVGEVQSTGEAELKVLEVIGELSIVAFTSFTSNARGVFNIKRYAPTEPVEILSGNLTGSAYGLTFNVKLA